jgi:hypothetical protein
MNTTKSKSLIPAYQRLVKLIESHADELSRNLLQDLRKRDSTSTFHTYDEKEIYERAFNVYSHLGKWISRETTKDKIAKHYTALGAKRRKEGFALSEIIQALIMTRRHLWLKVLAEGFLDTALDLNQALDLNNRVILFFDRAIFYTAVGYQQDK